MKRYSTIMSVLLTLALPVAGSCADVPKPADKAADASVEATKGAATKTKKESVEAIKESMSKTKHGEMMGGSTVSATGKEMNPSGKVVETMNGGGYTYANLDKNGSKTWVAFPTLETRVGDTLSFKGCMEMPNFQSKALNRKFDSILFCGSPEVKASKSVMSAKKSPGSTGATAGSKKVSVEKATGANAYTVAEIFAKRDKLSGKQVVVRGQVVKVSTGIMNKNWIHLQDGTGSDKQKTRDLVVTSNEVPNEGDVVTASGTVTKDKDFGSGYKYAVIMEKATLKK